MFSATYQIGVGTTIAAYCAHTKEAIKVNIPTDNELFPHGVAGHKVRNIQSFVVRRDGGYRIWRVRFSVIQFAPKMMNWRQSLSLLGPVATCSTSKTARQVARRVSNKYS